MTTWLSQWAGLSLNTDASEISVTGDANALSVRNSDKIASFVGVHTDTAHP